jgi:hypothetical protein
MHRCAKTKEARTAGEYSGQHAPGEQLEIKVDAELQLSWRAIGAADLAKV